jgi:3',5'-cyclic-AMP phosphodiesterase
MSTDSVRLVQISDTHLRATAGDIMHSAVNSDESLQALLRQLLESAPSPDLVVATGDLVHDPCAAAYQRLQRRLAEIDAPVYALCGNHDDPRLARHYLEGGNVSCSGSLQLPQWQLIFLDSSRPGRVDGELSVAELERLQRLLESTRELHAMLFLHHPPVAIDSPWMDRIGLSNSEALFAVVDRHPQVRAVVFGHIHQQFEGRRGGVALIGSPSTCVQFRPRTESVQLDARPPACREFLLRADGSFTTSVAWLEHCQG